MKSVDQPRVIFNFITRKQESFNFCNGKREEIDKIEGELKLLYYTREIVVFVSKYIP